MQKPSTLRLTLAGLFIVVGWSTPLLIPLVLATDYSVHVKTVLSGLLAFGIPEVFTLVTICILGKDGFNYLKAKIYTVLRLTFIPKARVSQSRYRVGLILFTIPILFGWALPYGFYMLPEYGRYQVSTSVVLDSMFILSLFVLGGDFWGKLRALYIYSDE